MDKYKKIFVAGHRGMVGSAIVRLLEKQGFDNLVLPSRDQLDLRDYLAVEHFFDAEKPDLVILAAAQVGGIQANIDHPAEFLYNNLTIQNNVIHQAYIHEVKHFCFIGSSCIYPAQCPQPMKEKHLLTGSLEPTNEGYALAKIAGLKMIEFYRRQYGFCGITIIPCNLYGTNDSFDPLYSHVLSALTKKFVDAVDTQAHQVRIWGSGKARREFMDVDDAARAALFMIQNYNGSQPINIGCGQDVSIEELASIIAEKTNYKGDILWDTSRPDGMLQKCLDVSKMKDMGFSPIITLAAGIEKMISQYNSIKKNIMPKEPI